MGVFITKVLSFPVQMYRFTNKLAAKVSILERKAGNINSFFQLVLFILAR